MFHLTIVIDTPESVEMRFDTLEEAHSWVREQIDEARERLEGLEEIQDALDIEESVPVGLHRKAEPPVRSMYLDTPEPNMEELEAASTILDRVARTGE